MEAFVLHGLVREQLQSKPTKVDNSIIYTADQPFKGALHPSAAGVTLYVHSAADQQASSLT